MAASSRHSRESYFLLRVDTRVQSTKLKCKGSVRSVLSRHRPSIARIVLHLLVQYRCVLHFNRTTQLHHFITRSNVFWISCLLWGGGVVCKGVRVLWNLLLKKVLDVFSRYIILFQSIWISVEINFVQVDDGSIVDQFRAKGPEGRSNII